MSNGEVALKSSDELVELEGIKVRRDQIELIKRTIFVGATDDELRLFFYECARRGTHPMDRLIFPVSRKDKDGNRRVTFQTGIDYLRAASEETCRYVGQKPVLYGATIKQDTEEGPLDVPEWAEVIVLRKDPETGEVNEIPFRAYWKEYYPGQRLGHMWRKMPHHMLGKCAEAGALRKGFPRKLGGLYINEEMEQAEAVPFMERQAITPPQAMSAKLDAPSDTKADADGNLSIDSVVHSVEQQKSKPGAAKEWTKYHIHAGGEKFSTFDKQIAEAAKKSSEMSIIVTIVYAKTQYGNEIVSLTLPEERLPGIEG